MGCAPTRNGGATSPYHRVDREFFRCQNHCPQPRNPSGRRYDPTLLSLARQDDFDQRYASRHGRRERAFLCWNQHRGDHVDCAADRWNLLLRCLYRFGVRRIRYSEQLFYGGRVTVREPLPDLVVESPSVSDTTPDSQGSFVFSATVRNRGTLASGATTIRYYRSDDRTISTSDTQVGTGAVGALSAAGSSSETITLPAPSTEGTYYYGACVDSVSGESNTQNNCSSAVAVFGGGPFPAYDLAISSISLDAPSFAIIGSSSIKLTVSVTNSGPNASRPAKLRFSGGRSFDLDIPVLEPDGTMTYESQTVGTARLGTTTYRACIAEAPGEENTDNNCRSRSVTYLLN